MDAPLHITTPLWDSPPMARACGARVLLKMEALQPLGSFKIRGIGQACTQRVIRGARHLIASSGGNAGHAVAYAGRRLGVTVEVFVPETTPADMRDRIAAEGAVVTGRGRSWDDAHAWAMAVAAEREDAAYIHPFDDPDLWLGHATMLAEIVAAGARPDAMVVAVGGGGLMIGVLTGMHAAGWRDVPVLAVETEGAASLHAAVAAGELVTLPAIESIATSLGARTIAREALAWTRRHPVVPHLVDDAAAVRACERFADDHRVLVEPACGAALAAVYEPAPALAGRREIVVIVCGGAGVSLSRLASWSASTGVSDSSRP